MNSRCDNCAFWFAHDYSRRSGDCRRHAPGPMYSLTGDRPGPIWWPKTLDSFWCGDFVERPEASPEEKLLQTSIHELYFSTRVQTACECEEIHTIGDVIKRSEAEWMRTPNIGRKAVNEIKEALLQHNLTLKPR